MSSLTEKVYTLLSRVPKGRVTTYKALAQAAGTRSYRAVGQILRHNPYAPKVPCHRVVSSDGSIGGFMGKTSGSAIRKKIALLRAEGVETKGNTIVHFHKILFIF